MGIAAALLGDPKVLMFDEPVNGLDPEGIRWIRNLMRSLAGEGRTVFVSSHLMSEMENTADRLLPGSWGRHVNGWMPTNAGLLILQQHADPEDVLTAWQGIAVFAGWTALLLLLSIQLLRRRDV